MGNPSKRQLEWKSWIGNEQEKSAAIYLLSIGAYSEDPKDEEFRSGGGTPYCAGHPIYDEFFASPSGQIIECIVASQPEEICDNAVELPAREPETPDAPATAPDAPSEPEPEPVNDILSRISIPTQEQLRVRHDVAPLDLVPKQRQWVAAKPTPQSDFGERETLY